jgi:hypothetical protein
LKLKKVFPRDDTENKKIEERLKFYMGLHREVAYMVVLNGTGYHTVASSMSDPSRLLILWNWLCFCGQHSQSYENLSLPAKSP